MLDGILGLFTDAPIVLSNWDIDGQRVEFVLDSFYDEKNHAVIDIPSVFTINWSEAFFCEEYDGHRSPKKLINKELGDFDMFYDGSMTGNGIWLTGSVNNFSTYITLFFKRCHIDYRPADMTYYINYIQLSALPVTDKSDWWNVTIPPVHSKEELLDRYQSVVLPQDLPSNKLTWDTIESLLYEPYWAKNTRIAIYHEDLSTMPEVDIFSYYRFIESCRKRCFRVLFIFNDSDFILFGFNELKSKYESNQSCRCLLNMNIQP